MQSVPTAADSQQFVARAVAAGVDARVDVWEGMPHGFAGGAGQMEAAAVEVRFPGEIIPGRLDRRLIKEHATTCLTH